MEAIIMAAGFGSRLGKISNDLPKSFLEINGEKLIERAIRLLKSNGIDNITVVTGYKSELFIDCLGLKIKYVNNPLYFCTNVLSSFACAMGGLQEDFIFLHADTIFEESILRDLIHFEGDIVLPVDFKKCVEEEMRVITSGNKLQEISKVIPLNLSEGEFIGLAKFSKSKIPDLYDAVLFELKENSKHQDYFEAALQHLVNTGTGIDVFPTSGRPWIEIDFEEDFFNAKALFEYR